MRIVFSINNYEAQRFSRTGGINDVTIEWSEFSCLWNEDRWNQIVKFLSKVSKKYTIENKLTTFLLRSNSIPSITSRRQ